MAVTPTEVSTHVGRQPGPDVVRGAALIGVVVMNYLGYSLIENGRRTWGDDVVADDDVPPVSAECANRRDAGDGEAVDERFHPTERLEKSAMKMPSAAATQIAEINQKRMMTVVSGQPINSK